MATPASPLQCPYLCVKRLILEQQCRVEAVPCVAALCREMKSTVNVLFPPTTPVYHGTFSTLIKKPVFTLNAARGCHSFPAAALKGAIEFPTNKQVRPRGFPPRFAAALMAGLPARRGSKNSNIYSNYLDEGSWKEKKKKKRGGTGGRRGWG